MSKKLKHTVYIKSADEVKAKSKETPIVGYILWSDNTATLINNEQFHIEVSGDAWEDFNLRYYLF